jgi:hypothetical protein
MVDDIDLMRTLETVCWIAGRRGAMSAKAAVNPSE